MFNKLVFKKHSKVKPINLGYLDRKRTFISGYLLSISSIIILGIFTLVPFILVLVDSLDSNADTVSKPFSLSDQNFNELFDDDRYLTAAYNSFLYAVITVPTSLFVSTLISWALSSLHRKYARGFWQSIFFVPYITSVVAITLSFAYIFDGDYGLLNTIIKSVGGSKVNWLTDSSGDPEVAAMTIFGVWRNIAFEVLVLSTAMMSVDKKMYKVSEIDGAKPFKQFLKITLPEIWPTFFYLLTLSLIQSIKVFPLALFSNSSDAAMRANGQTLLLYTFHMIRLANYGLAASSSIILAIVSLTAVLLLRVLPNQIKRFNRKRQLRSEVPQWK